MANEPRTILITGGGSGIGLVSARLFVENGDRVAIAGRNADKLKKAADSLGSPDSLMTHSADISDSSQVEALVQAVTERFGPPEILVNNAGVNIKDRAMEQMTNEAWDKIIRANLDGAFYCIHAVLPTMRERKSGLIININSVSGKRGGPLGGVAYAAAKHGMRGLAMCVGAEEKSNGIRVCSIYPGEVDTPILENRPSPVTEEHRARILQPEDIASAVFFVAGLPPRATVPELVMTPTSQTYV